MAQETASQDVDQMSDEALQREYADLREESVAMSISDEESVAMSISDEESVAMSISDEESDRLADLWNELTRRSDVQQPKCPECGARDWGFSDHIECRDCGYGTHSEEDELRQDIQSAWNRIMHGEWQ
ncbi:hypothetical protein [Halomarina oriensis]|uniref:Uncharacterized protein n=1 Tax=Halomarina oriensis TaxID=671145 RepID=A0A6B0GNT9_9EURY|nr:hypothetical protein [Halomarina oriensis]MWG36454.1 hypothetical protein [Halomarina oriensis]